MMRKENLLFQFNQKNPINRGSDKAHGAEIKVETREGEGSEFISAVTKLSSMKNYIFHVFFLFLLHISHAQEISIDSLKSVIKQHKEDTTEVNTLVILANSSQFPDAISYGNQGLRLAQKINYKKGEAN